MGLAPVFTFRYVPALDGLRAVSILAVLSRHSGWLPGGYLGVDVFFALSGFLITALLAEEYEQTGTISILLFYARRALRLLPALAMLVVSCQAVLLASAPREFWPLLLQQGAAVMFYFANWAMIGGLNLGVFLHTWSLAIEEQFYLLWPIVLIGALRVVRDRRALAAIVLIGAGAACLWRVMLIQPGVTVIRAYAGLDTHADPLLLGCGTSLLLCSLRPATGLARTAVRAGGVIGVLALCALFVMSTFPSGYARYQVSLLTALAAALIMTDVSTPGSLLACVLEWKPLVSLGRISYGVYLWHVPVFMYFHALSLNGETYPLLTLITAWAVTIMVALVSYVVVERPALALKRRYSADVRTVRKPMLTARSASQY